MRRLPKSGEANAVNAVGACHENGFGRKRDLKGAMQWYQRSAELGNSTAMRNLARLNDAGIGTPRDARAAAAWLRKALRSGAQATLNDLISTPGIWNKATYQELQRLLKDEGLYSGQVDGIPNAEFDDVLWTRAAASADDGETRLKQEFVRVPLPGAPRGLLVRVCSSAPAEAAAVDRDQSRLDYRHLGAPSHAPRSLRTRG